VLLQYAANIFSRGTARMRHRVIIMFRNEAGKLRAIIMKVILCNVSCHLLSGLSQQCIDNQHPHAPSYKQTCTKVNYSYYIKYYASEGMTV